MIQKKLYRALENIASKHFNTEKELLTEILEELINDSRTDILGGRVWQLDTVENTYKLYFQCGKVQKIPKEFALKLHDYQIFDKITEERTILASETNETLIAKGIFKYSASGIGNKVRVNGKKYYEYLIALNSNEIGKDLRYTLNIVATVLTSKLHERKIAQSQQHLIADLDKAKELQRSILPEHEYRFHNYDIFGVTIPAEIIGGDFYDYLKIGEEEDRLGIVVGDAASKGIAAAAEAMYISGAVRMASTFQLKISPMMNRLNQLINKIFSDDKFATIFYGELSNDKKGLFLYANAGHNPPLFYSKYKNKISYLQPTGPLIGPAPNSKYETDSINFYNGDILVIYTDGVVESANHKYEFYEEKRLEKIIKKNVDKTPKEIVALILDDVIRFSTSESQYIDDKTIVVIKRKDR
ncbi:MAG: PP2C family protein-serine/threonine phosphatase [Melioribacteraceae bacterium]